ncbi:hypothetical protein G6F37_011330 [Rhizopus arrhizus]|nr:hypothetical protein G6F37_011330 [Rhizopus arrhizus]
MTAQEQWDYVKSEIRLFTQRYAIDYTIRLQCLSVMDQQIESLQQELVDIAALKAGIRWREHGEKSAGYFKRIHQVRTVEQSINCLQDTTSGSTVSSRTQLMEVSQAFYQELYSVDPVDEHGIDCYLQDIADLPQLNQDNRRYLISPITIEDMNSYVFMHLVYQFSPLKGLITKIYNTALAAGSFPSSCQDLRVRLLPKKGDLSTLRNWRPISLISCDAKIYTRIINQQMRSVMDTIINRYQTGFLGDRFIAENGMILNILMEQAHVQKRPEIGLLLDQEKAYDRVHPMYLRQTMLAFGFPPSLVHSLESLFFGNAVRININGYFTNRIDQRRGLRRGNPLSPLFFNIAVEPFLRHILQDSSFQGFQFQVVSNSATTTSNIMPPPLKVLAYADDVCILLHSTDDYCRLRHHLDRYGSVSNAKVNIHKTEAFSLDGRSYPEWIAFLAAQGISKWHDHSSPSPLRYLGFPLIQSFHQRRYLEQQLLQTVKSQCTIYSQHPKLGGLGLLDPQIQQHNLQIRWIRQVLEDNHPQSCNQSILLDHIRRFHSGNTGTRLALFFPLLQLRPAAHANHFMQNIYEAVDSFGYADTQQAKCTPATLLSLTLSAIFAMIPTDYWITRSRHKKLKVSQFFTYDHHFGCIRPLFSSDQPSSPRLVSNLRRDIHNRIIKLNQLIWPYILNQNQPFAPLDQLQT